MPCISLCPSVNLAGLFLERLAVTHLHTRRSFAYHGRSRLVVVPALLAADFADLGRWHPDAATNWSNLGC